MIKKNFNIIFFILFFICFNFKTSNAENVEKIEVLGNERISKETIILFSEIQINETLNENKLNKYLKNLYDTNFFKDVSLNFKENILKIYVSEYPIIENIEYNGIKSNKILDLLKDDALIKSRYSFNEVILINEKKRLKKILKDLGYYNANVEILIINEDENNNLINLSFNFDLKEKAKIKKIKFIGNKIFKDRKLRRIISSEEYKFWKFISGKKFLNEDLVNFDIRLLKNFYKNNGYFNVVINSSYAKALNNNDEFELIFNIDAKSKVYFNELNLILPEDFDKDNFRRINQLFKKIKDKPYSINIIDKILNEIDLITAQEQYQFVNATVRENLVDNKINLEFKILETEKYYVEKINIFGNNVTAENVIRNEFEVDEGDPFNEILVNKSVNNLKNLGFFKSVDSKVTTSEENKTKKIDINVQEQPTGEITASAGFGTSGSSLGFGIKENNFLGQGVKLNTNFSLGSDTIKGFFFSN